MPIWAKRPSLRVRARHYVRRHRALVAATAISIVCLLVTGATYAGYRAWRRRPMPRKRLAAERDIRVRLEDIKQEFINGRFESIARQADEACMFIREDGCLQLARARLLQVRDRQAEAAAYLEGLLPTSKYPFSLHETLAQILHWVGPLPNSQNLTPPSRVSFLHRESYLNTDAGRGRSPLYYVRALAEHDPQKAIATAQ